MKNFQNIALLMTMLIVVSSAIAQEKVPDIKHYLARIKAGETEQVRNELPALVAANPDDPGVRYLQAILSTDGSEAARIYESILETSPQCEWADDALYRLARFYEAVGFTRTAELRMERLRKEYPNSPYAHGGTGEDLVAAGSKIQPLNAGPVVALQEKDSVGRNGSPTIVAQTTRVSQPHVSAETNRVSTSANAGTDGIVRAQKPTGEIAADGFVVQVGAFSLAENADRVRTDLEHAGYVVEVVKEERDGHVLHVVRVGNYATAEKAREQSDLIRDQFHVNGIVVPR